MGAQHCSVHHQFDRFRETFHKLVILLDISKRSSSRCSGKSSLSCCCNKSSILVTEILFAITGFPERAVSILLNGPFIVQPKTVLTVYGPFPWLLMTFHGSRAFGILHLISRPTSASIWGILTSLRYVHCSTSSCEGIFSFCTGILFCVNRGRRSTYSRPQISKSRTTDVLVRSYLFIVLSSISAFCTVTLSCRRILDHSHDKPLAKTHHPVKITPPTVLFFFHFLAYYKSLSIEESIQNV